MRRARGRHALLEARAVRRHAEVEALRHEGHEALGARREAARRDELDERLRRVQPDEPHAARLCERKDRLVLLPRVAPRVLPVEPRAQRRERLGLVAEDEPVEHVLLLPVAHL